MRHTRGRRNLVLCAWILAATSAMAATPQVVKLDALDANSRIASGSGVGSGVIRNVNLFKGPVIFEIDTDGKSLVRVFHADADGNAVRHYLMTSGGPEHSRKIVVIHSEVRNIMLGVDTGGDPRQEWRLEVYQNVDTPVRTLPTECVITGGDLCGPFDHKGNVKVSWSHEGTGMPSMTLHNPDGHAIVMLADEPRAGNFQGWKVVDFSEIRWFEGLTDKILDPRTFEAIGYGKLTVRFEPTDQAAGSSFDRKEEGGAVTATVASSAEGAIASDSAGTANRSTTPPVVTQDPRATPQQSTGAKLPSGALGGLRDGIAAALGMELEVATSVEQMGMAMVTWKVSGSGNAKRLESHLAKVLNAEVSSTTIPGAGTMFQIEKGTLKGATVNGTAMLSAEQLMITLQQE